MKKCLFFGTLLCAFVLFSGACAVGQWEDSPEFEIVSFSLKKTERAGFLSPENFLRRWTMLAAFPAKGLHEEYVVQEATLCGRRNAPSGTKWFRIQPDAKAKIPGAVDFSAPAAGLAVRNPSLFYFCITLNSDASYEDLVMKVGSAGNMKVWINSLPVYSSESADGVFHIDRDKIKGVRLEKGLNRIVVKYMDVPKGNFTKNRLFSLRFTDAEGRFSMVY